MLLSKEFTRSAIAELAEMREWRGAIGTILTYGVPVVGTWPQDYHDRVETNLAQVAVAASTAGDQDALQLLRNEFGNLSQWADGIVSARQSMDATNTVNPNYMQNDPLLAKISSCTNFLNSMLVSGGIRTIRVATRACAKMPHSATPSEARNLSSIESTKKERFLGKMHASE